MRMLTKLLFGESGTHTGERCLLVLTPRYFVPRLLYYYRRRVCVFAKCDQFLPVRSHFDTKRPVNLFHMQLSNLLPLGDRFFAFVLCVLRQKIIKRTENARKAYRSA